MDTEQAKSDELQKYKSLLFKNRCVLVKDECTGAAPLYAALSFLEAQLDIEASQVFIFTPKEEKYGLSEEREYITVDAWLLKNGQRGKTARLLNRVQLIQVDSLAQLLVSLSTFPAVRLQQELPEGPMMVILHDLMLLGAMEESVSVSSERMRALHLAVIGQALGALELGRRERYARLVIAFLN
ncbi:hypothetical protein CPB86DRAFT_789470 [Serendipita vermifera]|nr:hypothetical protein CPB86DRAFT_789470 [Serendipita vermifera]